MYISLTLPYLQQKSIAGFLFNARLDATDVCDQQVVADPLNVRHSKCYLAERLPGVLVERVLDANHWIFLGEILVHCSQLINRDDTGRI